MRTGGAACALTLARAVSNATNWDFIGAFDEQKIDVIYAGINNAAEPINWDEKEKIKTQYADGNEYFIFIGDTSQLNNLLNLLKAFSHFKKWQKSGMQLLIVKKNMLHKDFATNLKSFKYRNDVKLLKNPDKDQLAHITAAAYAIIYFPACEDFENSALQAMKFNVPLITCNMGSMPEICADAALYVSAENYKDVAEKLIYIFKNENTRQQLIEKARKRMENFSLIHTSELLWQSILKSIW